MGEAERQIQYWETRTTDTAKKAIEFTMVLKALEKLVNEWSSSTPEEKQVLARSIFRDVIYNLDTKQIVAFQLKAWAEKFLQLRAALYPIESKYPQEEGINLTLSGFDIIRRPLTEIIYWFFTHLEFWKPKNQLSRNELIRLKYAEGETLSDIARDFDISPQRVYQIVHFKNR